MSSALHRGQSDGAQSAQHSWSPNPNHSSLQTPLQSNSPYRDHHAEQNGPRNKDVSWLFNHLWHPDEKLLLPIPDTVLFESGNVTTWFFTNREGRVMKRNALPQNDYTRIRAEFDKFHIAHSGHQAYTAVARKSTTDGTHTIQFMMPELLSSWLEEAAVTRRNTVSLQSFISSKHTPETCFRVEYVLQDFSKPYIYTLKSYTAVQETPLVRTMVDTAESPIRMPDFSTNAKYIRRFTPSRIPEINGYLESLVANIVRFIEAHENVKFLKTSFFFMMDAHDKFWFYHATHITILDISDDATDGRKLETLSRLETWTENAQAEDDDDYDVEDGSLDPQALEKLEKSHVVSQSRIHLPSKCYGDYCDDSVPEASSPLRRKKLTKNGFFKIMNKSIVLARLEERTSKNEHGDIVPKPQALVLAKDLKELAPTDYYAEVTVCPTCYYTYLRKDMDRREAQEAKIASNSIPDPMETLDQSQQRDRLYAQLSRSIQRSVSPLMRGSIVKKLRELGETRETIGDFINKEESFAVQTRPEKSRGRLSITPTEMEVCKRSRNPSPLGVTSVSPLERSQSKFMRPTPYPYVVKNTRQSLCRISSQVCVPFRVIQGVNKSHQKFVNYIIFNDFIDDFESLIPLLSPITARAPCIRFLIFNYPGQARSKIDCQTPFNNTYAASVLDGLLSALEKEELFSLEKTPTCLISFGLGASVAVEFVATRNHPSIGSILAINPILVVDTHISVIFDNIFSAETMNTKYMGGDTVQKFFSHLFYSEGFLARQRRSRLTASPLSMYKDGTLKAAEAKVSTRASDEDNVTPAGRRYVLSGFQDNRDTRHSLPLKGCCFVVVRSTENPLVQASHHVDIAKAYDEKIESLDDVLGKREGLHIRLVEGGHRIADEQPSLVRDLILSTYEFMLLSRPRES